MGNIKQGPNTYQVLADTTLADIPNIASIVSRIYRFTVGQGPKGFNPTVSPNLNTLKVVSVNDQVQINAMVEADLPMFGSANIAPNVGSSGSWGPWINLPATLGQTLWSGLTLPADTNKIDVNRVGGTIPTASRTTTTGSIQLDPGVPGATAEEVKDLTSFQYRIFS